MKINITLFLLLTFLISNAQEVPFGDFENWDDQTEGINEDLEDKLPPETVLFPKNCKPIFAAFSYFGDLDFLEVVQSSSIENTSTNLFNVSRSNDAHGGDYALKFGGSAHNEISHLNHSSKYESDELPSSLSFYYKHIGEQIDTLYILSSIGSKGTVYLDSFNYENTRVIMEDSIISATTEGYLWRSIDVKDFNLSAKMDTFNFDMYFFQKPADSTSYWIIDNVQWNIETPTYDTDQTVLFKLGQSIDNQTIFPYLDQTKHSFISSAILSENGAVIKEFHDWSDQIDITNLVSGRYVFYVEANGRRFSKLFIKY